MFTALPHDIVRLVLEDYLTVNLRGLSRLDVAFCNHESRADALSALAQVRVIQGGGVKQLGDYMRWLASRKIMVKELIFSLSSINGIAGMQLPQVTVLRFWQYFSNENPVHVAAIGPFMACFPNIKELNFENSFIKDIALLQFCEHAAQPLEVLNLKNCGHLSPEATCMIAASCKAALRELNCSNMHDPSVRELAALQLQMVRVLTMGCQHITDAQSIITLCASVPQLEQISLQDACREMVNADLMQAVAQRCAKLTSVKLTFASPKHGQSVVTVDNSTISAHIIENCPLISRISISHWVFDGRFGTLEEAWKILVDDQRTNGKRICNLSVSPVKGTNSEQAFATLCNVIAENGMAIGKFSWKHSKAGPNDLRLVAEKFGPDLEKLVWVPTNDINPDTLSYVLSRCPNLLKLRLGCGLFTLSHPALDDACIVNLADYCPKLLSIELCGGGMTDNGVIAMLEGYKGRPIQVINLLGSKHLTVKSVRRIGDLFPALESFGITGNITKETLLKLLVARAVKTKEVIMQQTYDDFYWMKKQLDLAKQKDRTLILPSVRELISK